MHKKISIIGLLIITLLLSGCTLTLGEVELGSLSVEKDIDVKVTEGSYKTGEVIYENKSEMFSFGGIVYDSIVINVTTGGVGTEVSYPLFIPSNQKIQLPNTNTFIEVKDMNRDKGEISILFSKTEINEN